MAIEFDEVRFPEDVSYGSSGGPTFKTQVFESYRGYEKRNIDWKSPIMEFNVAYGIKTTEQMHAVIDFFTARQGRLRGFRYKNWANYQVVNDNIAIGDGVNNRLPLIRTYGVAATQTYKRLYKIVQGTVTGVRIGASVLVEGVDYNIDYNSGEIIFKSNVAVGEGIPVKCSNLEFDEPVRFDVDSIQIVIDAFNSNTLSRLPLVGIRDTFDIGTTPAPDATVFSLYSADDPFYGSTRLSLLFDDTVDPTTTVDSSRYSVPVTLAAPAIVNTDNAAGGAGSLLCGLTGYAEVPGDRFDFSDPNIPFDIELYTTRPTTVGESIQPMIGKWDDDTNNRGWLMRYERAQSRLRFLVSVDGIAETSVFSYPWVEFDDDVWQHVNISRISTGTLALRIDGRVVQTSTSPGAIFNPAVPVRIGGSPLYDVGFGAYQGGIDSLRITYARSRYPGLGDIEVPRADYPT